MSSCTLGPEYILILLEVVYVHGVQLLALSTVTRADKKDGGGRAFTSQ